MYSEPCSRHWEFVKTKGKKPFLFSGVSEGEAEFLEELSFSVYDQKCPKRLLWGVRQRPWWPQKAQAREAPPGLRRTSLRILSESCREVNVTCWTLVFDKSGIISLCWGLVRVYASVSRNLLFRCPQVGRRVRQDHKSPGTHALGRLSRGCPRLRHAGPSWATGRMRL